MGIDTEKIKNDIIEVFKEIYDPEIPVNIYDLGMIYDIQVENDGKVNVLMTLTSPNCPAIETLPAEAQQRVAEVPGVEEARLELVWEPAWNMDMMTEEAKLELNLL